jgi:hypothetical protein
MGGIELSPSQKDEFNAFAANYISSRSAEWVIDYANSEFDPFATYRMITWNYVILDASSGFLSSSIA